MVYRCRVGSECEVKIFWFWFLTFCLFASWNVAKFNGVDPLVEIQDFYKSHLQEKQEKKVAQVEKVWPNTFEHIQKHTE